MKFYWLVEWANSPYRWPIYIANEQGETTNDPWEAERFISREAATAFILGSDIGEESDTWKAIEHGFETPEEEVIRRLGDN